MDAENTGQKSGSSEVTSSSVTSVDFATPDSMVGRKLDGRFVIEKNLTDGGADEGGIGVVYLARDLKMINKRVVVKVLQEAALKYKDIIRKFLHEEEALMRLDHPGIVRILDFGKLTDGNPFMVMEYIEGYSLRKALRTQGAMPFDVAAHLIESITDALSAAHAEKIIHRDIKPENIMLTPQEGSFDRVRLIDFGIARVDESTLAPKTEISRAIGTVRYISPEQLTGNLYLGPTADIYSVAVVAYEILTGQLPFRPETMIHMYRLQQEGLTKTPRELRPEIPPEAEQILLSGLEFDAENRPQNVRTFGRDLARSLRASGLAPLYETEDVSSARTELAGDEVMTVHRPSDVGLAKNGTEKSSFPVKWIAAAMLSLAGITLIAGIFLWNVVSPGPTSGVPVLTSNTSLSPTEVPARKILYHMTVQKMRGREPDGEPREIAEQNKFVVPTGTKIFFAFEADTEGYFYLWNESPAKDGKTDHSPLFPLPLNVESARATGGQELRTGSGTFDGTGGTVTFYLLWSRDRPADLEKLYSSMPRGKTGFEEPGDIAILQSYQKLSDEKPVVEVDEQLKRVRIKSTKDIVVHRFTVEQL